MIRSRGWLTALVIAAAISGCKREPLAKRNASAQGQASGSFASSSSEHSSSPPPPSAPPSAAVPHPGTPEELLREWTRALNEADLNALRRLYADRVRFYGVPLGREQVLEQKRQALSNARTFQQTVLDTPNSARKGEVTRISFHKRSGPTDAQRDTLATLVLDNGPPLLIREETDAATEKSHGARSRPSQVPTDCPSAVWLLIDSTAEARRLYEQIDSNLKSFTAGQNLNPGGLGPFMPSETGDGSYELALGVHHPERFEAYGWFTVHPGGKITISSGTLELLDAPVSPSGQALRDFKRLCPAE